jgi:hypothetical protein
MSDRELLELAAKAAGITGTYFSAFAGGEAPLSDGHGPWNPLTNSSDALRLAVKLRLDIEWLDADTVFVGGGPCVHVSREGADAATRRAIVRAAAELGRTT